MPWERIRATWASLAAGRSWSVALLCSVGPAVLIGIALVTGGVSLFRLLSLLVGNTLQHIATHCNTLQNGSMEAFLWRGAVLTRLRLVIGEPWSIVVSSLAFGLWHIGTNLRAFHGQLAPALAFCIVSQAAIGVAFALLFVRTRNLLAPSVAHVLLNVASSLLG